MADAPAMIIPHKMGKRESLTLFSFPGSFHLCTRFAYRSFLLHFIFCIILKLRNNYIMYLTTAVYTLSCTTRIFYHLMPKCQYNIKIFCKKFNLIGLLCNKKGLVTKPLFAVIFLSRFLPFSPNTCHSPGI